MPLYKVDIHYNRPMHGLVYLNVKEGEEVDKFTVELSGFDLFVHLVTKHNWSDKKTINFMKENNQDVSFYEEYQKIKKEYLEKPSKKVISK